MNLGPELSCTSLANMTIKMEMSFTDSIVKLVDSPNNLAYAPFFFRFLMMVTMFLLLKMGHSKGEENFSLQHVHVTDLSRGLCHLTSRLFLLFGFMNFPSILFI